jgi:cytochrome oxidase Cu insertion factor (SCO1/SenC/PrrC family)
MPGMSTGLSTSNPTIVSAFYDELLRQGLVVAIILVFIGVAWSVSRSAQLRRAAAGAAEAAAALAATAPSGTGLDDEGPGSAPASGARRPQPTRPVAASFSSPEAPARRLLRVSFGLLWIFDGILQGQASMPLGMAPQVIEPAAATSPGWVQHLDNSMATIWSYHPVAAPAAVVWIQVGLGVWLLAASRGTWSRLGGLASAGWGLIVWIFGEAFGQILSPGLTLLFGAPGAVLLYCAAGALVALPEGYWSTPRLGRWVLRVLGLFWVGMALLQAWPGRGFWKGRATPHSPPGTLTSMIQQMAATPQPRVLASWVSTFARFDAAHGWGVNLFSVIAVAVIGGLFLTARRRLVLGAAIAATVLCVADWVLIEDLGFMGGVGTDPNSMVPLVLLIWAGYLGVTRVPAPNEAKQPAATTTRRTTGTVGATTSPVGAVTGAITWREKLAANPTYAFRTAAAIGALAITLVGTAPMALAATNHNADPLLAQAVDGSPEAFNIPEPAVGLVDQNGRPVSLASLRGKAVALTFLDPVCTSDCPVIAEEFRQAYTILGAAAGRVALVAVDANPRYIARDYLIAFDQQERMQTVANWLFLTGTLPQLQHAWRALGATVQYLPAGAMIDHSEFAYVIDPSGHIRYDLDVDPGPATEATQSSFAVTLAQTLKTALKDG